MPVALGTLETQFLAYCQMRGLPTVGSEEVTKALSLTPTQTRELLSRLARRRLIARVRRGLYLVPARLPPGGRWNPGEFLALSTLIADRGGIYQICGAAAFQRHGFTEQVPNRIDVYNNVLSGVRTIGAATFVLIKVADERLGATEEYVTPDGVRTVYSSRARTLVDAVYDWSRFGSLPLAYDWIRQELTRDRKAASTIAAAAIRYGNISTLRRLGKLFELEGVEQAVLNKLDRAIPKSESIVPWCPTRAKRGVVDRRWGVVFNG